MNNAERAAFSPQQLNELRQNVAEAKDQLGRLVAIFRELKTEQNLHTRKESLDAAIATCNGCRETLSELSNDLQ